jgi:hypothetical protein
LLERRPRTHPHGLAVERRAGAAGSSEQFVLVRVEDHADDCTDCCEQCVAVAGADRLLRKLLLASADVRHDLRPQSALRAAADCDDPLRGARRAIEEFEDLADAEGDALVDGPE